VEVMVASRTREIRPSGMKNGAYGNVGYDDDYLGTYRGNTETDKLSSKVARAVFLSLLPCRLSFQTGLPAPLNKE